MWVMSGEGVRRVEEMANLREKNGPVITRSLDLDLDLDLALVQAPTRSRLGYRDQSRIMFQRDAARVTQH